MPEPKNHDLFMQCVKFLSRMRPILDWVSALAVAATLPLIFWNLQSDSNSDRIRAVDRYSLAFFDDSLMSAQRTIYAPWFKNPDLATALQYSNTQTAREQLVRNTIESMELDKAEFFFALVQLLSFYDSLWNCVSTETCDKYSALIYFHEDAASLLNLYGSELNYVRSMFSFRDLGDGLIQFVKAGNGV